MVRITEDLVRKRAEHNESEIFSLEELSLHQQDIEKIEHLDKWCRELKILYLQSNLIDKIENVGRLKKLEYLNLALNNVERIENLSGCESLKKLDLTVNFVGELSSIQNLRSNFFLEEIYLTGNPCVNFDGYRDYVIASLPQLRYLDGKEIEKSERIKANQIFEVLKSKILIQEAKYLEKREAEKKAQKENKRVETVDGEPEEEKREEKEFWNTKCEYTPESRKEIQEKMRENKEKKTKPMFEKVEPKRQRRYFTEDGRPLNVNEGKIDFKLTENDDDSAFILDVACYKFMDTSLIDVDVQPTYVRVTMKSQVLQLALLEEVVTSKCSAQRSQTTGHLVVTMPKLNPPPKSPVKSSDAKPKQSSEKTEKPAEKSVEKLEYNPGRESLRKTLETITENGNKLDKKYPLFSKTKKAKECQEVNENFQDNPEVPPLI